MSEMENGNVENTNTSENVSASTESSVSSQPTGLDAIKEKIAQGESVKEAAPSEATTANPAPVYQPNYKFKYYDKEGEFDEFLRSAVKSKEHEDKLRDIYSKAFGLDDMKSKYTKVQSEYAAVQKTLNEDFIPLKNGLAKASQMYKQGHQTGDLQGFFDAIGVSYESILKYVQKKLDYNDLPPAQKEAYDRANRLASENMYANDAYNGMVEQYQALADKQRGMELNFALNNSEVAGLVSAYDSKLGAGAFRNEVIEYGKQVFLSQGRDIDATEAVNAVLGKIKPFIALQEATQAASAQPQAQKPPVLPNVSGKAIAPTAVQPKSIADLKRMAAAMRQ
jgi:hypothetical protein